MLCTFATIVQMPAYVGVSSPQALFAALTGLAHGSLVASSTSARVAVHQVQTHSAILTHHRRTVIDIWLGTCTL